MRKLCFLMASIGCKFVCILCVFSDGRRLVATHFLWSNLFFWTCPSSSLFLSRSVFQRIVFDTPSVTHWWFYFYLFGPMCVDCCSWNFHRLNASHMHGSFAKGNFIRLFSFFMRSFFRSSPFIHVRHDLLKPNESEWFDYILEGISFLCSTYYLNGRKNHSHLVRLLCVFFFPLLPIASLFNGNM